MELLERGSVAGARTAEGETAADLLEAAPAPAAGVAGGDGGCGAAIAALRRAESREAGTNAALMPPAVEQDKAGARRSPGGCGAEIPLPGSPLGGRALAEALLDEPKRAAELVARTPRLGQLLAGAKKAKYGVQLQHLLSAVHSNGAFQLALAHGPAREAVSEVLRDPSTASHHMSDDDDRVVDAVRTVRRLQDFCRSISISAVRMADLEAGPGTEEADRRKAALLQRAVDERLDAAAKLLRGKGTAAMVGEEVGSTPAPASSAEEAPRPGRASPGDKRPREGVLPPPAQEAEVGTETEERALGSHWAKFKKELIRQLLIGALALAVTKLVMFLSPPGTKLGLGQDL